MNRQSRKRLTAGIIENSTNRANIEEDNLQEYSFWLIEGWRFWIVFEHLANGRMG